MIDPTERCSQLLYKCACYKLPNGEDVHRDWLAWNKSKGAVFCFPCRLFTQSSLFSSFINCRAIPRITSGKGYTLRFPNTMQESMNHKRCYVAWRNLQKVSGCNATISLQLHRSIPNEAAVYEATVAQISASYFVPWRKGGWRSEESLSDSLKGLGTRTSGNFLGILEVISHLAGRLSTRLNQPKSKTIFGLYSHLGLTLVRANCRAILSRLT